MNAKAEIEKILPARNVFTSMYLNDGIAKFVDPAHVTMRQSRYENESLPNGYYEYPNRIKVNAKSKIDVDSDRITIDGIMYYLSYVAKESDNGYSPKYPKWNKEFIGEMDIKSALVWIKSISKITDHIYFSSYNGSIDMYVVDSDDIVSGFWHYESSLKVESESVINCYPTDYMIDILNALVNEGYDSVMLNVGRMSPIEFMFGKMLSGKWALAPRISTECETSRFMIQ